MCHRIGFVKPFMYDEEVAQTIVKRRLDGFDEKIVRILSCFVASPSLFGALDEDQWDAVLSTILWEANGFGKLDREIFGLSKEGRPVFVEMWEFDGPEDSRHSDWVTKNSTHISIMTAQAGGFEGGVAQAGMLVASTITRNEGTPASEFLSQVFPADWFLQDFWPKNKHHALIDEA